MERVFVDTNVWVYAVDSDEPAKREIARSVLAPGSGTIAVVSAQVMAEFFVVTTRKLRSPLTPDTAAKMLATMAGLSVVPVDAELVLSAVAANAEWNLSPWDALIVRAAQLGSCTRLLTEDLADGAAYGSVVVANPFRSATMYPTSGTSRKRGIHEQP